MYNWLLLLLIITNNKCIIIYTIKKTTLLYSWQFVMSAEMSWFSNNPYHVFCPFNPRVHLCVPRVYAALDKSPLWMNKWMNADVQLNNVRELLCIRSTRHALCLFCILYPLLHPCVRKSWIVSLCHSSFLGFCRDLILS